MMELGKFSSPSGEISFLDKDDISGPGRENYVKRTGDKSVDYALFKISQFSSSSEPSERIKFTKELEELSLQLGSRNLSSLIHVLHKLTEDSIDVKTEMSTQLPSLFRVLIKEFNMYSDAIDNLLPILDKLLDDKNQEVVKAACGAIVSIAELLTKEDCATCLLTMVLRILHDEDEDTKLKALGTLKDLMSYISSDFCECFIAKEAMLLSSETIVKVRKSVAECIPKLTKCVSSLEGIEKLMKVFDELAKDNMWGVRKACVENISEMFEGLDGALQEKYALPFYETLLNDKSNSVRQSGLMQIGPCIHNCKTKVPDFLMNLYIEMSRNTSNKGEIQYHVAYYFPGVLQRLGKSSWNILSQVYNNIIDESDAKTKKCLISSVHEIGKILEIDMSTSELVPIYERVLSESIISKQLVLPVLSKFLKVIRQDARVNFLKYIKSMYKISASWRIRLMVAEQLEDFIELFEIDIVINELYPIASALADDKIAKIREKSALGLGKIINLLISNGCSSEILQQFRNLSQKSSTAYRKQVFALACQSISPNPMFPSVLGNEFRALCDEKSPNLRICCAKAVKKARENNRNENYWVSLFDKFSLDFDADVRYEVTGKYDIKRGIHKLRPNSQKASELMFPMVRALFPDDDLQEVITFSLSEKYVFEMIKSSIIPSMNGLYHEVDLSSVQKSKMKIDF
ncbi:hypothetical protein SteCoe_4286 [Stentor coeruleus]|uniref:TOG domain-containing protein n=1 Tax=Stentor coeruleus TaxID=5963 RepID=A0A1R2CUZ8_9CILI|nr:hypothetical protein SteCoe_4286 [Stentor coeruleus]